MEGMFYEAEHSGDARTLQYEEGVDFSFPLHLHDAFELITVSEGTMEVQIDRTAYCLGEGDAVLVFPEQLHALRTIGHSRHRLLIFSPGYVRAFVSACQERVPVSNRFRPESSLLERTLALRQECSILEIKGALYSLAAVFDADAAYQKRNREKDTLLMDIFAYVRRNFTGECSLKTLSASLSYHYVYLSRYFRERTGLSFTEYVCRCRVSESCYRLTNSDSSITSVALECGFDSVRTFHRNFRREMGQTPSAYREAFSHPAGK